MRKFVKKHKTRFLVDALIVVTVYAVMMRRENRRLKDEYYPED
jgi:hypothetical protein